MLDFEILASDYRCFEWLLNVVQQLGGQRDADDSEDEA
jgi:hypothetical protein